MIGRACAVLLALAALLVLVLLPLAVVITEALSNGPRAAWQAITAPDSLAAIRLTLLVASFSVAINTVGGLAASWCIARFAFPGRGVLLTLIGLPLSVSPVISGLVWILLFGAHGWFADPPVPIVFAVPGLVLATTFVTLPYVAATLLPLLQAEGRAEEEAAVTLGATGPQIFLRVTLPAISWALLQGVLLCNARAMGEFGAVAVLSGRIRGQTLTLPLQVEALYNGFQAQAAFAVASLLALLAVLTLAARAVLNRPYRRTVR